MHTMPIKKRNPLLVVVWSFGLFVLMHTSQYPGMFLAAKMAKVSFGGIASGAFANHYSILWMGSNAVILGIPVVFMITKYLWRRDSTWMLLDFNIRLFFDGAILGLLVPICIVAVLSLFDVVRVTGHPTRFSSLELGSALVGSLGLSLFTGIVEEVVFRGMAAREFAARYGWIVAAMMSGLYFGVVHLLSEIPTVSVGDALWIVLGAMIVGALFVTMLAKSGSLWFPIGFHVAWNFCLAAIIGTRMSGDESSLGLFETELYGSPALTGGKFGLELSVISILAYVIVTIILLRFSPSHRNSIPVPDSLLPGDGPAGHRS